MEEKLTIVCRCEDITLEEIRAAIADGYTDFEELKRFLRVGMGPCGGRTCSSIIRREIARFEGVDVSEIELPSARPPLQVTTFGAVIAGKED